MKNFIFLISFFLGFIWLIFGLILLLAEISTPGLFFFIAFAFGSVFAAICAFLNYSFMIQCLALLFGFFVAFLGLRFFVNSKESESVHTNVDALKGSAGIVIKEIEKNGIGLVKVGGEVWSAKSLDNVKVEKDTVVKIFFVSGSKLVVK